MTETVDVTARLAALSDAELIAAVRTATAGRPALAALRAAAETCASSVAVTTPFAALVPDHGKSKAGPDRMDEIRESLRRTLKPDR